MYAHTPRTHTQVHVYVQLLSNYRVPKVVRNGTKPIKYTVTVR